MAKVSTTDQQDRFIELRVKGVPYSEIEKEIGVSKPTLIKWDKELQLDISNRKALEWEYLQEKYFVSKKETAGNVRGAAARCKRRVGKAGSFKSPNRKVV